MTAHQYIAFLRTVENELRAELGGTEPVRGYARFRDRKEWSNVFCHPDDKEKTYFEDFKYPYRDI